MIHQRSSPSYSGHSFCRCGITCSAKSFEEYRVFQSGMLPVWNRQNTFPSRISLIMCSIRSRTVAGLPAMM